MLLRDTDLHTGGMCSAAVQLSSYYLATAYRYTESQMKHGFVQAPGRLVSWLRSRHKVFKVDKEYVSLKPNFLRKFNPAEFGPPGFPAQDKSAAHANAWQQGSRRTGEDHRLLYLEEKILNWLAKKDKVTTTEMAEFAYATHEELVPGAPWSC